MVSYILKMSKELGMPVTIVYQKGSELTQRRIKVLDQDETCVKAFCYLRNGKRTFRKENILSASLNFEALQKAASAP